jgi:SAM-dependent methyltransferase
MPIAKLVARSLVHLVADSRKFYYSKVASFANEIKNMRILELGSGPKINDEYYYSTKHLFDISNEFIQSDVVKEFGHPVVDATNMKFAHEFDAILCLNVLEHIYEYELAIQNIYLALKPGGTLVVAVPFAYPLHDEPGDYWRFTEHGLRKMFSKFKIIEISYKGKREFPFGYYVEAKK